MTEKEMWQNLRKQFKDPKYHITRIENAISFGTPDVHLGYQNLGYWIENKIEKSGGYFLVQPSQLAWHLSRLKAKCYDSFFLVYMTNASWCLYPAEKIMPHIVSVGMTVRVLISEITPVYTVLLPGCLSKLADIMYEYVKFHD